MSAVTAAGRSGSVAAVRRSRSHRGLIITSALALAAIIVAIATLGIGAYAISPAEVIATLLGRGDRGTDFVILQLRLPRLALGVIVGAAFGVAGAMFQTVLHNPLASPDVIGISGGASAAAVFAVLILGASGFVVAGFAFGGALVVALLIYLLAWRDGLSGYRFVLIGIGMSFAVTGVIGYLITRADVREAAAALVWMVGSLGSVQWPMIALTGIGVAVLLVVVAIVAPRIDVLRLGDDTATGLGVRADRNRLGVIVLAVGLVALATAAAGPIAFVAFLSAPIARRLVGTGSLALVPSALVGVLVVTVADLIGQHGVPGVQVPVGIVTGVIGAPYLLWLIAAGNRPGKDA